MGDFPDFSHSEIHPHIPMADTIRVSASEFSEEVGRYQGLARPTPHPAPRYGRTGLSVRR
jgi:hypothetical protein